MSAPDLPEPHVEPWPESTTALVRLSLALACVVFWAALLRLIAWMLP